MAAEEDRLLDVVGDEQDGHPRAVVHLQQRLVHGGARDRVHPPERLVEQQHRGLDDERPQDLDPALDTAGELARVAVGDVDEADLTELLAGHPERRPAAEPALDDGSVGDVLHDRAPREQRGVLEHDHPVRAGRRARPARPAEARRRA